MLSIGAKMNFISAQTGDREETLKRHYAKYIDDIDPQREWIEKQIRQSAKSEKSFEKREKSSFAGRESRARKMKKPLESQGLKNGAGEEGRTPDLMLGKHTL